MDVERTPIVNWSRTARRLRFALFTLGGLVILAWLAFALAGDGLRVTRLAELVGVALLVALFIEFVIVGGAAVRGMLLAGERGDRLARHDVALLPPQLLRRRSSRTPTDDRFGGREHDADGPVPD